MVTFRVRLGLVFRYGATYSDYLATILAAVIITLESRIPAAGILVHTPYNAGCRNYKVRKS